jgi:D-alanyl-D-alanine carboxypeptidase
LSDFIPTLKVQPWPHQSSREEMDAFYGDPRGPGGKESEQWKKDFLVHVVPPWKMIFVDDKGKVAPIPKFQFNKKAAPSLTRVLDAIWDHYGEDQSTIDGYGLNHFGGSFNFRKIRGSHHISNHAYGCAIDLDPEHNPLGAKHGRMPPDVVALFAEEGWRWGGNYHGRKDWMHFEAVR